MRQHSAVVPIGKSLCPVQRQYPWGLSCEAGCANIAALSSDDSWSRIFYDIWEQLWIWTPSDTLQWKVGICKSERKRRKKWNSYVSHLLIGVEFTEVNIGIFLAVYAGQCQYYFSLKADIIYKYIYFVVSPKKKV